MDYEVIFYIDHRNRSPVKDFLDELNEKAHTNKRAKQLLKKVALYIEVLENTGSRAGIPYTKFIGNKIWELRPNNYRIFFFMWHNNQIVLLHTFRKTTNKTPLQEIIKAENEMNDWLKFGHERFTGD